MRRVRLLAPRPKEPRTPRALLLVDAWIRAPWVLRIDADGFNVGFVEATFR
jgi:hypothetical protein